MKLNETLEAVKLASRKLALLDSKKINDVLISVDVAAIDKSDVKL